MTRTEQTFDLMSSPHWQAFPSIISSAYFLLTSGQTPYQYITRLRLERARRMVQQNVDLAAIAMETGFSDQAHLSRKFKKAFGITLLKYRQLYLNQGFPRTDLKDAVERRLAISQSLNHPQGLLKSPVLEEICSQGFTHPSHYDPIVPKQIRCASSPSLWCVISRALWRNHTG